MRQLKRRSNNKSSSNDSELSDVEEILMKTHDTRVLNEEDLNHLLHLNETCQFECAKNNTNSPHCFCKLISTNDSKLESIWKKNSKAMASSLPNPNEDVRSIQFPAGLNNIRNICYLNSILQCLYRIPEFRNVIFSVDELIMKKEKILFELGKVFAHLELSNLKSVNPMALVSSMNINVMQQEDGQEFFSLFITHLSSIMEKYATFKLSSVKNIFQGSYVYKSRCQTCGRLSESSETRVSFMHLDINVKGFENLHQSMQNYFKSEKLSGENKLFCEFCTKKTEFRRKIQLKTLPPVLCFQLKRYVYDQQMSIKKVNSQFNFPLSLNMRPWMKDELHPTKYNNGPNNSSNYKNGHTTPSPSTPHSHPHDQIFDLTSILIHKGKSTSEGHYIAHLKHSFHESNSFKWFEFDDSDVVELEDFPPPPITVPSSSFSSKTKRKKHASETSNESDFKSMDESQTFKSRSKKSKMSERPTAATDDDMHVDNDDDDGNDYNYGYGDDGNGIAMDSYFHPDRISSTDAYMLIYRARSNSQTVIHGSSNYGIQDSDTKMHNVESLPNITPAELLHQETHNQKVANNVPDYYKRSIDEENEEYEKKCKNHEKNVNGLLNLLENRKEEIKNFLFSCTVSNVNEHFYFVSTKWMKEWANSYESDCSPIDNTPLQCKHNKLFHKNIKFAKCVNEQSWNSIFSKLGASNIFTKKDVCRDCIFENAKEIFIQFMFKEIQNNINHLLNENNNSNEKYDRMYYVSKSWFTDWLKKGYKNFFLDCGPTTHLICPHNKLAPEKTNSFTKRQKISHQVWQCLLQVASVLHSESQHPNGNQSQVESQSQNECNQLDGNAIVESHETESPIQNRNQIRNVNKIQNQILNPCESQVKRVKLDLNLLATENEVKENVVTENKVRENDSYNLPNQIQNQIHNQNQIQKQNEIQNHIQNQDQYGDHIGHIGHIDQEKDKTIDIFTRYFRPFPSDCEDCEICSSIVNWKEDEKTSLNMQKMAEQKQHKALFLNLETSLKPNSTYFLLPSEWLQSWRRYIKCNRKAVTVTKKNENGLEDKHKLLDKPPPNLSDAFRTIICKEHGKLLHFLPELSYSRGKITQKNISDFWTIVDSENWNEMSRNWNSENFYVLVTVIDNNFAKKDANEDEDGHEYDNDNDNDNDYEKGRNGVEKEEGKGDEFEHGERKRKRMEDKNDHFLKRICKNNLNYPYILSSSPNVCEVCLGRDDSASLVYEDAEINIFLKNSNDQSQSQSQTPSKRNQTRSNEKETSIAIPVSSQTTIHQIKMQVWASFQIVLENQRLGFGQHEILDNDSTLGNLRIPPNSQLWIVDNEIHEYYDIAEYLVKESLQPHFGFQGSCLMGSSP